MESEARAEWLRRGFFEEDFKVEKMIKIWEDEDSAELVRETKQGGNKLEEKMALIQSRKDQELTMAVVLDSLVDARKNIVYGAKSAVVSIKSAMETPYQRRRRELKEHVARITAMEKEAKRLEEEKLATKELRFERREQDKERVKERKEKIKFEKPSSDILRTLLNEANERDRQKQIDEWDKRRIDEFERVCPPKPQQSMHRTSTQPLSITDLHKESPPPSPPMFSYLPLSFLPKL